MVRQVLALVICTFAVGCGSKASSPTQPSTPTAPATTKLIRLLGAMDFQAVQLGQNKTNTLTVFNDGNTALTVTGLTVTSGLGAVLAASPQAFTVAPGGKQDITVRFTPAAATSYSGTITVASDSTGGTNTIPFAGQGTLDGIPIFTKSGSGNQVWDMPAYVKRVRIQGTWNQRSNSNFIVYIANSLIVNAILRETLSTDGTYLISGGGVVETVSSDNITWTFTEVR